MLQSWLMGASLQKVFLLVFAVVLLGVVAVSMLVWLVRHRERRNNALLRWGTGLLLLFFISVSALAAFYSYSYFTMKQRPPQDAGGAAQLAEQLKEPAAPATAARDVSEQAEKEEARDLDLKTETQRELSRRLMGVERELRSQLLSDEEAVAAVDAAYQSESINTYEQLVRKAKLEIQRRDHMIQAMDEKIALIKNSSALNERAKLEALHGNVTRKTDAEQERAEYETVLQHVEAHKADYENL